LEGTRYIPDIDHGGSTHITLEVVGDVFHYIHPPLFAIFWLMEEEGK